MAGELFYQITYLSWKTLSNSNWLYHYSFLISFDEFTIRPNLDLGQQLSPPGYQAPVKKASQSINERQEGQAGEKRVVREEEQKKTWILFVKFRIIGFEPSVFSQS